MHGITGGFDAEWIKNAREREREREFAIPTNFIFLNLPNFCNLVEMIKWVCESKDNRKTSLRQTNTQAQYKKPKHIERGDRVCCKRLEEERESERKVVIESYKWRIENHQKGDGSSVYVMCACVFGCVLFYMLKSIHTKMSVRIATNGVPSDSRFYKCAFAIVHCNVRCVLCHTYHVCARAGLSGDRERQLPTEIEMETELSSIPRARTRRYMFKSLFLVLFAVDLISHILFFFVRCCCVFSLLLLGMLSYDSQIDFSMARRIRWLLLYRSHCVCVCVCAFSTFLFVKSFRFVLRWLHVHFLYSDMQELESGRQQEGDRNSKMHKHIHVYNWIVFGVPGFSSSIFKASAFMFECLLFLLLLFLLLFLHSFYFSKFILIWLTLEQHRSAIIQLCSSAPIATRYTGLYTVRLNVLWLAYELTCNSSTILSWFFFPITPSRYSELIQKLFAVCVRVFLSIFCPLGALFSVGHL